MIGCWEAFTMSKNMYRKLLSPLKKMLGFVLDRRLDNALVQIKIDQEIDRIINQCREITPKSPICNGFKAYSQVDEDGIIENIFERIGSKSKIFCEIGASSGLENNTHYLLLKGWRGIWMEGSTELTNIIKSQIPEEKHESQPSLCLVNDYISKENINDLINKALEISMWPLSENKEIDLLSIDIDGNDLEVLDAIDSVKLEC